MKQRIKARALKLSALGLVAITAYEVFVGFTYKDSVGVPTIGYGTTVGVKMGDKITPERALARLNQDIDNIYAAGVQKCVNNVPLYQHEFDSFVSLTYNIGVSGFCNSTIVKRLKQKPPDYAGACEAIKMWNKAGGKVVQGLVARREKEYRTCIGE
jgi:lysozyme